MKKRSLFISILLLAACHHENPLKTHTPNETAHFLMQASANVEKRLHFTIKKDSFGFGFLECLEGRKSTDIQCDDLREGMVRFAKENHYPDFNAITLSDLTDESLLTTLGDDYVEVALTTQPHFFE